MKGLLYKEFSIASLYKRNFIMMFVLGCVLSFFLDLGGSFIPMIMMMFLLITSMSSFSVDDTAQWDRYAVALPVSRRQIVGARYLYTIIMMVLAMAVGVAAGLIIGILKGDPALLDLGIICAAMSLVYLFINSLLAPVCYKFGAENARFALMMIFMVPYLGALWALPRITLLLTGLPVHIYVLLIAAVVLLILAMYLISYHVSVKIYEEKEF